MQEVVCQARRDNYPWAIYSTNLPLYTPIQHAWTDPNMGAGALRYRYRLPWDTVFVFVTKSCRPNP
jgi:hypothetical protein